MPSRQQVLTLLRSGSDFQGSHFSYEQSQIWPRLSDSLPPGEAGTLAARWASVRATAASKPHPHLPPDPRLLGVLMPILAVLDRVADALRARISLPGA